MGPAGGPAEQLATTSAASTKTVLRTNRDLLITVRDRILIAADRALSGRIMP